MGRGGDPHQRIGGADPGVKTLPAHESLEALAQIAGIALIDLLQPGHGGGGIGEGLHRDGGRGESGSRS
jgi:hypothetical protein